MRMSRFASIVMVALALLSGGLAHAAPPAGAPGASEGRRLQHAASGTDLHVPAGWFAREEATADGVALFVSKEDIATSGSFQTGFSLNWFSGFHAGKRTRPSEYAAAFAAQIATTVPGTKLEQAEIAPGIVAHEARYNIDSDGSQFMMLYLVIGDDRNDTLRLAWYEAPESTWDADWVHGETIVNDFLRGVVRATSN